MDDSIQQIRNRILGQIREVLFELPEDDVTGTMRILGDTPTRILDPNDFLESIRPFTLEVQNSLCACHGNKITRLLAVSIHPDKHSYFVVDLNNADYEYQTAHLCKSPVPVYVLCLSSKRRPTISRRRVLDSVIAETLAKLHDDHGQDPLPLFDNHCDNNRYDGNPRSLQH